MVIYEKYGNRVIEITWKPFVKHKRKDRRNKNSLIGLILIEKGKIILYSECPRTLSGGAEYKI